MSTDVVMPQMGESIAEGTIVRWIKKVGDKVDRDEPLFEVSTDKVDAEIPSPAAGVVSEIRVKEGETVPINSVVAVIGGAVQAAGAVQPGAPAAAPPEPPRPSQQADGAPARAVTPEGGAQSAAPPRSVEPPTSPAPSPRPAAVRERAETTESAIRQCSS